MKFYLILKTLEVILFVMRHKIVKSELKKHFSIWFKALKYKKKKIKSNKLKFSINKF